MKKIIVIGLIMLGIVSLSACKKEEAVSEESGTEDVIEGEGIQFELPGEGDTVANLHVKDFGVIKIKFFEEEAPKAVENFITHAKEGYYDGLTFHRVMNDFMIQGGDPSGNGTGGESIWGEAFEDEFSEELFPYRGALCMANSGTNTNGSQFFIVQLKEADDSMIQQMEEAEWPETILENYKTNGGTPWLWYAHTVFGQVYEGMDIVDAIAKVETDSNDKPEESVIIEKIEIVEY